MFNHIICAYKDIFFLFSDESADQIPQIYWSGNTLRRTSCRNIQEQFLNIASRIPLGALFMSVPKTSHKSRIYHHGGKRDVLTGGATRN